MSPVRRPFLFVYPVFSDCKRGEQEMKKNLTELVMILDKSGSMSGLESDTIGGYRSMLEKQKETEGEVLVSTILFNERTSVIHNRESLNKVEPMTRREYIPGGCTALLDAVGSSIDHIVGVHRNLPDDQRPAKTIFVIITDGLENASREYSSAKVKKMIETETKKYGWEFIFLGANIDAVETAGRFGIDADHSVNYHSDPVGTALNYEVLGDALARMRTTGRSLEKNWKKKIEEDYENRG